MSVIKDFRTLFRAFFVFFFVFLIHRVLFWIVFSPKNINDISMSEVIQSWFLGLRFDLRIISIFLLTFLILFFFLRWILKWVDKPERFLLSLQASFLTTGLWLFMVISWLDMGNYSYLSERLNSKIFALMSNMGIAWRVLYESYPLLWIIFGIVGSLVVVTYIILKFVFHKKGESLIFSPNRRYGRWDILLGFVGFLFILFSIHSKISQYPLRWSEAYFSKNNYINQFALNPLHNIFDTYKFSKRIYEDEDILGEIREVQKDLGVRSNSEDSLLIRYVDPKPLFENEPNIVVIMMESLAAFKVGAYGAPLNTTPHLDKIIRDSLWFDNFHVNQTGTAASIFCLITGIPDLNEEETASRNPLIVDQHTMVNNFKEYEKYYFIGGDANWGNIRGVLKNNIYNLNLIEEKDFSQSRTDIWGISDLEVFEEAHKRFQSLKDKKFFAFIQTAGYHIPHTLPKRRGGFEELPLSEEHREKYGLESERKYNSLRFSDHALGHFFNLARKSDYYKNTLFVIYADHGLSSSGESQLSSFYKDNGFTIYHVPLVFHSPLLPKHLMGKKNSILGYEPDILPTLQSMVGISGVNSSFGLDLLSKKAQRRKGIFLKGVGAMPIKFFDGKRMVYTSPNKESAIKSYKTKDFLKQLKAIPFGSDFLNEEEELSDEIKELALLGRSYFKVMKFKLRNNQKERVARKARLMNVVR